MSWIMIALVGEPFIFIHWNLIHDLRLILLKYVVWILLGHLKVMWTLFKIGVC